MENKLTSSLKFQMEDIHVPTTLSDDMCHITRPSSSQRLPGCNQNMEAILLVLILRKHTNQAV